MGSSLWGRDLGIWESRCISWILQRARYVNWVLQRSRLTMQLVHLLRLLGERDHICADRAARRAGPSVTLRRDPAAVTAVTPRGGAALLPRTCCSWHAARRHTACCYPFGCQRERSRPVTRRLAHPYPVSHHLDRRCPTSGSCSKGDTDGFAKHPRRQRRRILEWHGGIRRAVPVMSAKGARQRTGRHRTGCHGIRTRSGSGSRIGSTDGSTSGGSLLRDKL